MRLYAFQGLRYADHLRPVGDLAAPPYDQIDDELESRLHASSPYNFTHLTRPLVGEEGDPSEHAARLHRDWLRQGVVLRDRQPSLYLYVVDLKNNGKRLGILGLVGLEDPDKGVIRPHEGTLDKPLADLGALLRATRADLEPILLLADDGGGLEELLTEDLRTAQPLAEHRAETGNRHRIYRLTDPVRIGRYQEALADRPAAIADGHHRYKVACSYACEVGAKPGTPAAAKLAVVTSLASPALSIEPFHRGLTTAPPTLNGLDALVERTACRVGGGEELAARVAAAPQPTVGAWRAGGEPELWRLAPAAGGDGLAVAVLHRKVLPPMGVEAGPRGDEPIEYYSDADELFGRVARGEVALGLWLPPMDPASFFGALDKGDLLPPKSTRFTPKVASGLVWTDHRSELR